jgi:hypothetical protein
MMNLKRTMKHEFACVKDGSENTASLDRGKAEELKQTA